MRTISATLLASALAATTLLESADAFAPALTRTTRSPAVVAAPARPIAVLLRAEAEEAAEEEAVAEEEEEAVAEESEQEEEDPEEDPEVTALKTEIEELEKTLKEKKSKVNYLKEDVDRYSKAGYARKVAEMENMRRARSSMASSNRETSTATVLRSFLPVKDKLDFLRQEFDNDEFGKQYTALAGNFNTALADLGVTDYTATPGESIDRLRVLGVEEEYSTEFAKDTVIQPLKLGLELKGNVIRMAECVASLGDEAEAKAAEEAAAEEGDEAEGEEAETAEE